MGLKWAPQPLLSSLLPWLPHCLGPPASAPFQQSRPLLQLPCQAWAPGCQKQEGRAGPPRPLKGATCLGLMCLYLLGDGVTAIPLSV